MIGLLKFGKRLDQENKLVSLPKEFLKMYYDSTNDYGFMIINNNSTSNNNNINSLYGSVRVPKDFIN